MFRPRKPRPYASTGEIVGRAYTEIGGAKQAEAILNRSHSVVSAYSEPPGSEELIDITFEQARRLTEKGATAFAEALAADAGGYFAPGEPPSEALERLVGDEAREQGEFVQAVMVWIEQHRSRLSQEKLAADLDRLIMTLATLRARVRA